jgi:hypothetical protein
VPGLLGQIEWFTREAPEAILAGRALPTKPELPPPPRRWLRRS